MSFDPAYGSHRITFDGDIGNGGGMLGLTSRVIDTVSSPISQTNLSQFSTVLRNYVFNITANGTFVLGQIGLNVAEGYTMTITATGATSNILTILDSTLSTVTTMRSGQTLSLIALTSGWNFAFLLPEGTNNQIIVYNGTNPIAGNLPLLKELYFNGSLVYGVKLFVSFDITEPADLANLVAYTNLNRICFIGSQTNNSQLATLVVNAIHSTISSLNCTYNPNGSSITSIIASSNSSLNAIKGSVNTMIIGSSGSTMTTTGNGVINNSCIRGSTTCNITNSIATNITNALIDASNVCNINNTGDPTLGAIRCAIMGCTGSSILNANSSLMLGCAGGTITIGRNQVVHSSNTSSINGSSEVCSIASSLNSAISNCDYSFYSGVTGFAMTDCSVCSAISSDSGVFTSCINVNSLSSTFFNAATCTESQAISGADITMDTCAQTTAISSNSFGITGSNNACVLTTVSGSITSCNGAQIASSSTATMNNDTLSAVISTNRTDISNSNLTSVLTSDVITVNTCSETQVETSSNVSLNTDTFTTVTSSSRIEITESNSVNIDTSINSSLATSEYCTYKSTNNCLIEKSQYTNVLGGFDNKFSNTYLSNVFTSDNSGFNGDGSTSYDSGNGYLNTGAGITVLSSHNLGLDTGAGDYRYCVIGGFNGPTWSVDSKTGTYYASNTFVSGQALPGFAELYENEELGEIPYGRILQLDSGKVRFANNGEIGFLISRPYNNAAFVAGDPMEWHSKYLTDNFGQQIKKHFNKEEYLAQLILLGHDEAERTKILEGYKTETIEDYIVNPLYNANAKYVRRSERRGEWTTCEKSGIVILEQDGNVTAKTKYIISGESGIAKSSSRMTNIVLLSIIDENYIKVDISNHHIKQKIRTTCENDIITGESRKLGSMEIANGKLVIHDDAEIKLRFSQNVESAKLVDGGETHELDIWFDTAKISLQSGTFALNILPTGVYKVEISSA
jgi:hypothetical protein